MKNSMEFSFQKLKTELPYDPAILLLGIYAEAMETGYQRDACIICLLQHYSQDIETT